MAVSRQRKNVAYGIGQPLYSLSPEPIISSRAPTTADMAELGTLWTNKTTNAAWVLASVVSNSATWTPTTVNAGATITTGDLNVVAGNINIVAGNQTILAGNLTVTAGTIQASAGDLVAGNDVLCTRSVVIGGDDGTGTASNVTLTNVVDETVSTGAGVVLMKTANPGDSSGWLKIYNGTNVRYVPYWTDISP